MSFAILWLMKRFVSVKQRKGELGEFIVCRYLSDRGFLIIERNYTKKCGEIDIIAQKEGVIHFIEVKSVSCEMIGIRPEDNMHSLKQRKMAKTVSVYLMSHDVFEWQCDLACVYLNDREQRAGVEIMWNIIL
jgi:putative endonuclease